ncbi:MAG: hypothetical protein ABJF79_03265, partial [Paracoccaceae bacterium]
GIMTNRTTDSIQIRLTISSNGENDGIPGIVGWETEDFVTAMHAYKGKHRDNQVMQMVTGRLANDEIAALAAYFKSLEN